MSVHSRKPTVIFHTFIRSVALFYLFWHTINVPMNLLSAAHMCSDSLCNVIAIEYVPVDLIVNALRHFLNTVCLVLWLRNIARFPYVWVHIGPSQSALCRPIWGENNHHLNKSQMCFGNKRWTAWHSLSSVSWQRIVQHLQLASPSNGAAERNLRRIIYEHIQRLIYSLGITRENPYSKYPKSIINIDTR